MIVYGSIGGKKRYVKRYDKEEVIDIISTYHYSKQFPRLTKEYLGYFDENNNLLGGLTLGWGTRPKHTIKKIWDELDTKDYYEIGKMAIRDDAGDNSASHMLSLVIKFIRRYLPEIKVLFTWADGMLGKPGYVYQSANFLYLGFSETDTYFTDKGERVHPRTSSKLNNKDGTKVGRRPTLEEVLTWGWSHYRGRQFKYAYIIHRKDRKRLINSCKEPISEDYPKEKDLKWRIRYEVGKWEQAEPPAFVKNSLDVYNQRGRDVREASI